MKKAFTLIELLVVVVIFMMIFLMTMSFVRLASGSVISARQKLLTNDIRNATEMISQKMNNANASVAVGSLEFMGAINSITIKGFDVKKYNPTTPVLSVISKEAMSVGTSCSISFFTVRDNALWMKKTEACINISAPGLSEYNQRLTSENTKVTGFELIKTDIGAIPYLTVKITAEDKDPQYSADNQIQFQTSYTIDYLTWKNMQ